MRNTGGKDTQVFKRQGTVSRKGGGRTDKRELLLALVAVSGELQADMAVYALGSAAYTAALITKLKKEGLLAVRSREGAKGYVLREKGKKLLMHCYPGSFDCLFHGASETNHVKSEITRRLRLHRMSMAWAFGLRMGMRIFPAEKPMFPPKLCSLEGCVYYGAAEFKGGSDKVKGSRACGLMVCGGQPYVVYHTMDQRMKWAKKTERSMRQFTERIFWKQGQFAAAEAIMIGNGMEMLREILESDGGPKGNLFQVDDIFEHWYYFSMQEESMVQLCLLTDPGIRRSFYAFLSQSLARKSEKEYALADGYDAQESPVYFCYELELGRLMRIKQETALYRKKGKVLCLDFQAEALHDYFGEEVEILAILSEKVTAYINGRRD